MNNSEFFNKLASDYDEMIVFDNSLKNKIESLKNFISPQFKTALDLGCGTGADSIALSKLGLSVTAVDHSIGMLEKARQNSERFDTQIIFIESNLTDLTLKNPVYDIIVSLGNTISNISRDKLKGLLKNLYNLLNNEGIIVIQIINYAKLPVSGIYLLKKFENEQIIIERTYEINADDIDFIIERTNIATNEKSRIITKLYPHKENDFREFSGYLNFHVDVFGSLRMEPFVAEKSNDLIVVLTK